MLIKLIRLFRGYVYFSVIGTYPERFINVLNKSGITYWNMIPKHGKLTGYMLVYDYKNIRPYAKGASVKLRCIKKSGFPFLLKKYSFRKGAVIGAVLALAVMFLLSNFVWDIKINGRERLSTSEICSALEDCGLKRGVLKSSVDFEAVERKLIMKIPEIRWISINALNGIAKVEIKEEIKKPKVKKGKYPCNLTADSDGIITKTIVNKGTCEVKKGSAVMKNQVLVSCVVKGTNEAENKLSFVHSNGKIYADIEYEKKFIIPNKKNNIILNSNYNEKSNLNFLWTSLPLKLDCPKSEIYGEIPYEKSLVFNNVTLPIGISSRKIYGFTETEKILDKSSAKKLLLKQSRLSEIFNIGKYSVKDIKYSFKEINNSYKLTSTYTVNKNIAKVRRVQVKKSKKHNR